MLLAFRRWIDGQFEHGEGRARLVLGLLGGVPFGLVMGLVFDSVVAAVASGLFYGIFWGAFMAKMLIKQRAQATKNGSNFEDRMNAYKVIKTRKTDFEPRLATSIRDVAESQMEATRPALRQWVRRGGIVFGLFAIFQIISTATDPGFWNVCSSVIAVIMTGFLTFFGPRQMRRQHENAKVLHKVATEQLIDRAE